MMIDDEGRILLLFDLFIYFFYIYSSSSSSSLLSFFLPVSITTNESSFNNVPPLRSFAFAIVTALLPALTKPPVLRNKLAIFCSIFS
eukprot:UN10776